LLSPGEARGVILKKVVLKKPPVVSHQSSASGSGRRSQVRDGKEGGGSGRRSHARTLTADLGALSEVSQSLRRLL
jgi:hypothetical protein